MRTASDTWASRRRTVPARARRRVGRPSRLAVLALMVMAALVIGLGLTHFFHIRIAELQAEVDLLQISNTVIADKNNGLVAAGAQEASKAQVVAMAKRKLKLFEPDQEQVRRISL